MTTYLKFLTAHGYSPFQHHPWHLPVKNPDGSWAPGKWMPYVDADLVRCALGYHACTRSQMSKWSSHRLYVLEFEGEVHDAGDKVLGRKARLLREVEAWEHKGLIAYALAELNRLLDRVVMRSKKAREAIDQACMFIARKLDDDKYWGHWDREMLRRDAKRIARRLRCEKTVRLLNMVEKLVRWVDGAYGFSLDAFLNDAAWVRYHLDGGQVIDHKERLMRDYYEHLGIGDVA